MIIKSVRASKIFNSRRQPTIEVVINNKFSAAAPSGASTGVHEAVDYTNGVDYAVKFLNRFDKLNGFSIDCFEDMTVIEEIVPFLGANPMIALEFAILRAASDNSIWSFLNPHAKNVPMPLGNCVGGGAHIKSARAAEKPDMQEFLLIPKTECFRDAVMINSSIHKEVGRILNCNKMTDEGAWSPRLPNDKLLELLCKKAKESSSKFKAEVRLGVDVAASTLWNSSNQNYVYGNFLAEELSKELGTDEQIRFIGKLIRDYGLFYVEDPLQQEDFVGFSRISKDKCLICGDDLICTNLERLKRAIKFKSVNAVIIKPNQRGSLIETKKVVDFALANKITPVMSHRSGETMDTTISHLAVAWKIPFLKCGIYRKEREVKLQELMKIEREMGF